MVGHAVVGCWTGAAPYSRPGGEPLTGGAGTLGVVAGKGPSPSVDVVPDVTGDKVGVCEVPGNAW